MIRQRVLRSLILALFCGCQLFSAGQHDADRRSSSVDIGRLRFAHIPAGKFLMGSPALVVPRQFSSGEQPVHTVRISHDFWLSDSEVTVAAFRDFVNATGYLTDAETVGTGCNSLNLITGQVQQLPETTWRNPGFVQTDGHPVVGISWNDATAFCRWFAAENDCVARLPTEAEWEYACRAGTLTVFSTGDHPNTLQHAANLGDETLHTTVPSTRGTTEWTDAFAFTAPVKSFKPNQFGLYDMHGNVGEWCHDWYDDTYYSESPVVDPHGPGTPTDWHVVRGGSWFNTPYSCRSSGRHDGIETAASTTNGFRIVVELR